MPIFFQHPVNATTRLGIWKIEEPESFFKSRVPQHRAVTHPHKRLQHLAGRFLLQYLFPGFPSGLIAIADTRKPFLPDEQYHFSISHCGDYAAAIVSSDRRVGVDIEIPVEKIIRVKDKFLGKQEGVKNMLPADDEQLLTLFWSSKEAIFKWFGNGSVDFRDHIHLLDLDKERQAIGAVFTKNNTPLSVHYRLFNGLVLAWVIS